MTETDRDALIERVKATCPRCGSPDPKKHPAVQLGGEVQLCSDPWHTPVLASPSPAQWPEDVVERVAKAIAVAAAEHRMKPFIDGWERDYVRIAALRFANAALATLPPPEDERVKGLERALETIDYIVNADTDWPADDVTDVIRSALASYRGGA